MINELHKLQNKIQEIDQILTAAFIKKAALPYSDVLKIVYPLNDMKDTVDDLILEEELYG